MRHQVSVQTALYLGSTTTVFQRTVVAARRHLLQSHGFQAHTAALGEGATPAGSGLKTGFCEAGCALQTLRRAVVTRLGWTSPVRWRKRAEDCKPQPGCEHRVCLAQQLVEVGAGNTQLLGRTQLVALA